MTAMAEDGALIKKCRANGNDLLLASTIRILFPKGKREQYYVGIALPRIAIIITFNSGDNNDYCGSDPRPR